jgi:hypothetical protein
VAIARNPFAGMRTKELTMAKLVDRWQPERTDAPCKPLSLSATAVTDRAPLLDRDYLDLPGAPQRHRSRTPVCTLELVQ